MFTELAYAMGPNPQAGQAQGGGLNFIIMMAMLFAVMYFLMIRPQQKRAKEHKLMLENLKKGDKVITSGGEYGIIEEVKTNTVVVKIAENVKVKYGKAYITGLRQSEDE